VKISRCFHIKVAYGLNFYLGKYDGEI